MKNLKLHSELTTDKFIKAGGNNSLLAKAHLSRIFGNMLCYSCNKFNKEHFIDENNTLICPNLYNEISFFDFKNKFPAISKTLELIYEENCMIPVLYNQIDNFDLIIKNIDLDLIEKWLVCLDDDNVEKLFVENEFQIIETDEYDVTEQMSNIIDLFFKNDFLIFREAEKKLLN